MEKTNQKRDEQVAENPTDGTAIAKPAVAHSKAKTNWLRMGMIFLFVVTLLGIVIAGIRAYLATEKSVSQSTPRTESTKAALDEKIQEQNIEVGKSIETTNPMFKNKGDESKVPSIGEKSQAIPVYPNRQNNPLQQTQPQYDVAGKPIIPRSRYDAPMLFSDGGDASNANNKPLGKIAYAGQVTDQRVANEIAGTPNADPENLYTPELSTGNAGNGESISLGTTQTPRARATFIGNRNYVLGKGTMIECVLNTALDSTLPGMTSCAVTRNVYSDNGKVVMIERGAVITGEYKSDVKTGQTRLGVIWDRIRTPHGVMINLSSLGTDTLGRSGHEGAYDARWGDRLGAAFLLSFIKDVIAYKAAQSGGNVGAQVFQNTSETGKDMADTILKETINVRPVITKNQGERISIFVARDLDFSGVYSVQEAR